MKLSRFVSEDSWDTALNTKHARRDTRVFCQLSDQADMSDLLKF